MMDLLELLLGSVLDLFCDGYLLDYAWRFFLPVLGALGLIGLICWRFSNSGAQVLLSVPVMLGGVITGIIWQGRKG